MPDYVVNVAPVIHLIG